MTQRNECLLDGLEDRGYLQLLRKAGIEAEVPEEVCAPDCAHSRNPAHLYEWRLSISDVLEEWLPRIVRIRSSADGTLQPAYFHAPAASGPVPLLVGLHTWSYDLTNLAHYRGELAWCRKHGWAFIAPNYRGPNYRKDGCGSELAVRDVVDAVEWAKGKAPIDPDRVYVLGGSGGGHMTLLLAGRHPELWAGCAAFCPIADLAAYHDESLSLDSEYSRHLRSACGGTPQECPDEYARRSPLTYLSHAGTGGVNLYIATGVHDGHKGRGSVPVSHAIRAYNAVAAEADRISDGEMLTILAEERIPGKKGIFEQDPFYGREKAVLLRRRSGNVQLTLFDGGHDCNFPAAYDWLSRQLRGRPADWTLPVRAESVRLEGLSK